MKKTFLCCLAITTGPTFIHAMQFTSNETVAERIVNSNVKKLLLTNSCGGCFLVGAYLAGINLQRADLREARLQRANLSGANLSYADLSGADLSDANVKLTNFHKTKLSGATLDHVYAPPTTNPWSRYIFQTPLDSLHIQKHTEDS